MSLTQLPIVGGSVFLVMKSTDTGGSNRIIGWEDASHGANGVALLTNYGGFGFDAVFRQSGTVGDIADISPNSDYEIIAMTWGASGSYFSRMDRFGNTTFESHNSSITAVTSIGLNLHIGSSGTPDRDGKWGGDLLELTLYDEQLAKRPWIVVANKMDLPESEEYLAQCKQRFPKVKFIPISAGDGTGLEALKKEMWTRTQKDKTDQQAKASAKA